MRHVMFIDRNLGSIHGVLTLNEVDDDNTITPVFLRLPINSGQASYTKGGEEDWVQGKGATPLGTHWLSTTKRPLVSADPKGTPFYLISTLRGGSRVLGPNGNYREDVGLHLENSLPGTAGCTALLWDTSDRKEQALALFKYLDTLPPTEKYIKAVVL